MMKNCRKYYILLLASVFILTSCGDFLEEYSQDHDYVRTWNDLNELLIGDCYMPVNASGEFNSYSNAGMFLHLFSDEIDENVQYPAASSSYKGFNNHSYQYGYLTWQPRVGVNENATAYYTENNAWTAFYKSINVANNVLMTVDKVPQQTDEEKAGTNYVKGQAHFLRAFYYFWLTNTYGQPYNPSTALTELGVPLKTSPEVEDIKFSRNTVQECYSQIVSDLENAVKELYLSRSIKRKSIYRADSISAQLLLSRVYLFTQNWEKAAEYAKKVIKYHGELDNLNSDKNSFASISNPETIFSMGGDDLPVWVSYEAQSLKITNGIYDSYSDNDLRKTQWIWTSGDYHGIIKQPPYNTFDGTKLKSDPAYLLYNYTNSAIRRNISSLFWLRTAEAYLNYAEAEAYLGHEDEARDAINMIRKNRYYSTAHDWMITSSGEQLIEDIRNERKRELVCEGHRWFDLRRYRVCSVQPEKISITHTFTIYENTNSPVPVETRQFVLTEDDPSWTAPIPQEVINFNTGMPNNGTTIRNFTIVETLK